MSFETAHNIFYNANEQQRSSVTKRKIKAERLALGSVLLLFRVGH